MTIALLREPARLCAAAEGPRVARLVGESPQMIALRELVGRVAPSRASVLLRGETGTGKELVAAALHQPCARLSRPFVVVDCGAIPPSLIESELFGHERGAFTGAVGERSGAFERAHGGTLFLDEVGELPLELQPRLLRAIEEREVRRLGGTQARRVDIRVIAATHRDVAQMVEQGRFRADLYYRLAVVEVRLPALRDRLSDLPLLVERLLLDAGAATARAESVSGENLARLRSHDWPGNVRELRNVLESALARAGDPDTPFGRLDLQLAGTRPAPVAPAIDDPNEPFLSAKARVTGQFERVYLSTLLDATGGNVSEAARRARLNRRHLYDLMRKHGLHPVGP